jgi:fibronectin-binding autotransporter adhesin
MKYHSSIRASLFFTALSASLLPAATFTWTNTTTGGSWQTDTNWSSTPALPTFATDDVLDFSTLNITANNATTLDGNVAAGTLKFGDLTTASNDWSVASGTPSTSTITLSGTATPIIDVVNRTATISAVVAGTQGFTKSGTGTLNLSGLNTYTGTTTISGGSLVLGVTNALPNTAYVNLTTVAGAATSRTCNIGSTSQSISRLNAAMNPNNNTTHTAFVTGASGSLLVNGAFDFNTTNNSGATAGGSTMTALLDMSGLGTFEYNQPSNKVIILGNGNTRSANLTLGGTNTLTALAVELQNGGAGSNTPKTSTFNLGQSNTINANTITVLNNNVRDSATMKFRALSNPSLTIRATNTTDRANWNLGTNIANSLTTGTALVDLVTGVTGGSTLNALIGTLNIGQKTGTGTVNASFLMGAGTLDATSISLGNLTGSGTLNATATVTGGTVKVSTLTFGSRTAGTLTSNFNLNGSGTLSAETISQSGTATRNLNWNDGTIKNYDSATDLTIASGISIKLASTGTHAFDIEDTRKATIASVLSDATTGGTLVKNGLGTVELGAVNTYSGNTTVNAGTLQLLNGAALKFVLGATSGTTNNITGAGTVIIEGNFDIDRTAALPLTSGTWVLENVSTLVSAYGSTFSVVGFDDIGSDKWRKTEGAKQWTFDETTGTLTLETVAANLNWNGNVSGVWDIAGATNWLNGVSSSTYAFGDNARFDDLATGTTSITLDTIVEPTTVVFDNSSKIYSISGTGTIQGFGSLTKSGTEKVTIATTNTYSGGTTINAGTLEVGNGGTTGSLGSGGIVNNGTLILNRADALTLPAALSGSGNLTQLGTGTSILAADNSYAGTTNITNGTLQVGNGGAAGSLGSTTAIVNNGTLAFNRSGTQSYALDISGTGQVSQNGPGTIVFDNDMTYSGATIINGGTLQLGTNGVVGSVVSTSIANDGKLVINRSDDLDFAKSISGSGSVAHAGSGKLRLTGSNTYSGNTILAGTGTLQLDSAGSNIPSNTGIEFTGNGLLDFTDLNLSITTLNKSAGVNATIYADPTKSLTVTGPGNSVINEGSLDMSFVESFVFNNDAGSFATLASNSGGTATTTLSSLSNAITANALTIGNGGPGGQNVTTNATLVLGTTNTINANSIVVGTNGAQAGSSILRTNFNSIDPTIKIRAAAGEETRATMMVGYKNSSDYSGGAGVVDFSTSGSTLDAKLSNLTLGKHDTGAGNFNNATSGTFTFNLGTLDATNIVMAEAGLPNNKTANGTLTSNGGTIKVENLKLVQDVGGALGTATVNLNQGATLEATNINGQAAANALINLNQGSIKNTPDIDLQISATTLVLPSNPAARSLVNSNASPILFSSNCVIAARLNTTGITPSVGNFTLTGALDITDVTLNITNNPGAPTILPTGTKLTLIDYTAGTITGTFNGIADDSSITIGANTFIVDYNDTLGATGSFVTLTAANGSPYAVWAANFGLNPNVADGAADGDFDKDGVANMTEYVLGTSPANGTQSALPVAEKSGTDLIVTFTRVKAAGTAGFVSVIEYSETLTGTWTEIAPSNIEDNGTTETVTATIPIPSGVTKIFARLKVTAP